MIKTLAIIPARGASKSIPNKNIRPVAGRPLLAWTITEAQAAESVDRIIVSTDSSKIADVAQEYGADIPFMRPAELAEDSTPGILPILHAIRWLENAENYLPDYVIALQPTSPLRSSVDIDASIQLAERMDADAVVSVAPVNHHPYWMKQINDEGILRDFISLDEPITRRQDLPNAYALNGAVYLARREILLERKTWYTGRTYAYVMPIERSLDVDSPWDIYLADLILLNRKNDGNNNPN
ncbi:MAG: acylneuraminate cytidylyltransferase family protein [Chloroflexota bacterium]|nr:acylneuraminate cytidylyltransferase family protein [Chloroflexota bacterium]